MEFGGVSAHQKSGKKNDGTEEAVASLGKLSLSDSKSETKSSDSKKSAEFDIEDVLKHKALVDMVVSYLRDLRDAQEKSNSENQPKASENKLYPTITAF